MGGEKWFERQAWSNAKIESNNTADPNTARPMFTCIHFTDKSRNLSRVSRGAVQKIATSRPNARPNPGHSQIQGSLH